MIDIYQKVKFAGTDTLALGFEITGFKDEPALAKSSAIDVPGGDGYLDVAAAQFGGPRYSNGQHTFELTGDDPMIDFAKKKTELLNLLQGQTLDYELSWDPGYTYRGKFSVTSPTDEDFFPMLEISVDRHPYKHKPDQTFRVAAGGGATVDLPSGRKRVSPVIECTRPTVVTCNGVSVTIPAGSHKVRGLYLHSGKNRMYLNSTPDLTPAKWEDYAANTWGDYAEMTWAEVAWRGHERPTGEQYNVYITYEWGDL